MQAMIFAAGLGTRLYPLTKDIPKALAPVGHTTLLENAVRFLQGQGFDRMVINAHHFAEKLEAAVEELQGRVEAELLVSHEETLLDTAGGLKKAEPLFHAGQPVLLYNVDVVTDLNLRKMWSLMRRENADVVLAVRQRNTSRYLLFDSENRLAGWRNVETGEEKLSARGRGVYLSPLAFSGIHIVGPDIFHYLREEKESLVPFYLRVADSYKILAYNHSQTAWFDCGKPPTLEAASRWLTKNSGS